MQNTLELACEHARRRQCRHIHHIHLRVGSLSGVVPDALQFAFEALKRDTIACQAQLEIELVPPVCLCESCQSEFTPEDFCCVCPQCGQLSPKLLRGRELELASLEASP